METENTKQKIAKLLGMKFSKEDPKRVRELRASLSNVPVEFVGYNNMGTITSWLDDYAEILEEIQKKEGEQ